MRKLIVAFDIDGTIRKNAEERHRTEIEQNDDVVAALQWLSRCKNVEVHLWSNRGALYCRTIRTKLGLEKYVKESHCHQKLWNAQQRPSSFIPDIAFDDQQRFDGGVFNIIVREK